MNTIHRGLRGKNVLGLKSLLKEAGLIVTHNNIFDLQTEAGVRTAQEKLGLEKDGIVGPKTWSELLAKPRLFNKPTDPIEWVKVTPYYPQRDNEYHPGGTCNVTSLAMVLAYHGVIPTKANQLEDELFIRLQKTDAIDEFNKNYPSLKKMGYKPRHIHGMLGWLARQYGFSWKYSEKTSRSDLIDFGKTTGPMIISGRFTSSGHIVTLVGMTLFNDLIVHDPWGDWNSNYRKRDGKYKIYNREAMEDVLSGHSKELKRAHRITPA